MHFAYLLLLCAFKNCKKSLERCGESRQISVRFLFWKRLKNKKVIKENNISYCILKSLVFYSEYRPIHGFKRANSQKVQGCKGFP